MRGGLILNGGCNPPSELIVLLGLHPWRLRSAKMLLMIPYKLPFGNIKITFHNETEGLGFTEET